MISLYFEFLYWILLLLVRNTGYQELLDPSFRGCEHTIFCICMYTILKLSVSLENFAHFYRYLFISSILHRMRSSCLASGLGLPIL